MIFALQEVQTSLIADPIKRRLSSCLIKELKKEGIHAMLLGKQFLQQHYQSRLDAIIDAESCFPSLSAEGQAEVNELTAYLDQINDSIESIEKSMKTRNASEPANQALQSVISQNSSLEGAQVFEFKPSHKGVILFPFLENGILLTKNDLNQLIEVVNLYKGNDRD
jgi:hypothetical protein